jgi:hypothetical protein
MDEEADQEENETKADEPHRNTEKLQEFAIAKSISRVPG